MARPTPPPRRAGLTVHDNRVAVPSALGSARTVPTAWLPWQATQSRRCGSARQRCSQAWWSMAATTPALWLAWRVCASLRQSSRVWASSRVAGRSRSGWVGSQASTRCASRSAPCPSTQAAAFCCRAWRCAASVNRLCSACTSASAWAGVRPRASWPRTTPARCSAGMVCSWLSAQISASVGTPRRQRSHSAPPPAPTCRSQPAWKSARWGKSRKSSAPRR